VDHIDFGFDSAFKFKFKCKCVLRSKSFLQVGVDKSTILDPVGSLSIVFKGETSWDF